MCPVVFLKSSSPAVPFMLNIQHFMFSIRPAPNRCSWQNPDGGTENSIKGEALDLLTLANPSEPYALV